MNLSEIVKHALLEDIGEYDHSSEASVPENAIASAKLLIKQPGILCGIPVAKEVFRQLDENIALDILINDGQTVKPGDIAFTVRGNARKILSGERLALNFLQRMSGIATFTNYLVKMIEGTHARLLDTRKTTPLLREWEKYAVRIGGAYNHRFGLFDMIMLKDNHIDYAGGIKPAIEKTVAYLKKKDLNLKIEIEVRNFDELNQVLEIGQIHRIMLDNFIPTDLEKAVNIIDKRYETEASGGITENNIKQYAETGVDFISVGALTHQIKSLDMSLKAVNEK